MCAYILVHKNGTNALIGLVSAVYCCLANYIIRFLSNALQLFLITHISYSEEAGECHNKMDIMAKMGSGILISFWAFQGQYAGML